MQVELKHHTPLYIAAESIRTAWQSFDKSDTTRVAERRHRASEDSAVEVKVVCGDKDRALIKRVGVDCRHSSTLEHLVYHFHISGVSRALLQEFSRHRIASLTVKSTRYTLKELKHEATFCISEDRDEDDKEKDEIWRRASRYLVMTGDATVDAASIAGLERVRVLLQQGTANDKVKFALPEAYQTEIAWTINARSLRNFMQLRSAPAALWEMRRLSEHIYRALPDEHKYLYEDVIQL